MEGGREREMTLGSGSEITLDSRRERGGGR